MHLESRPEHPERTFFEVSPEKMTQPISGTFEASGASGGHVRSAESDYRVRRDDPVIPGEICRALRLRGGETISATGHRRAGKSPIRIARIEDVEQINGRSIDDHLEARPFEDLTAISPETPARFETPDGPISMRIVDLMTPIGLGQRGLIVAPPRTGKTILLQQMAAGIAANYPDVYMIVLLVDERPEEVTDMRRTVHGEVVASSNDRDIASHVRIAQLVIDKAKRLVECGRDVLVLLDSLTRLGRAFNANLRGGGRIMSGGLDIRALSGPKAMFGAARNVEHGGSLTIIASCLIETGSRMDEVIFNEFKGTGNMEIMLTCELADRRIWPAIDLGRSGTRKEELLLSPEELEVSHRIRRGLQGKKPVQAMTLLLDGMRKHSSNADFVARLAKDGRR